MGMPIPAHIERAAKTFRYNQKAFIALRWPEIFTQDNERNQTVEEAKRTDESLVAIYREQGYELIELPRAPVNEHMPFLIDHIDET